MSIKAMTHVWEHCRQKGSKKLMMLAIADHADDYGTAFPGVERLALKCEMTERNAQLILSDLETVGEIVVDINNGVRTDKGMTNRYYLIGFRRSIGLTHEKIFTPRDEYAGVKNSVLRGEEAFTPSAEDGVKPASPKPSVKPSVESSESLVPSALVSFLVSDLLEQERITVHFSEVRDLWEKDQQRFLDDRLVYIGREMRRDKLPESEYANPFVMSGKSKDARRTALEQFKAHVLPGIDPSDLEGKLLVCWCDETKGEACHGHLLHEKRTGQTPEPVAKLFRIQQRPRNPMFDAVAEAMKTPGVSGGQVAVIARWLEGETDGRWGNGDEHFLGYIPTPATLEEVAKFAQSWPSTISFPLHIKKFGPNFLRWRTEQAGRKQSGTPSIQTESEPFTPLPPDELDKVLKAGRAIMHDREELTA